MKTINLADNVTTTSATPEQTINNTQGVTGIVYAVLGGDAVANIQGRLNTYDTWVTIDSFSAGTVKEIPLTTYMRVNVVVTTGFATVNLGYK